MTAKNTEEPTLQSARINDETVSTLIENKPLTKKFRVLKAKILIEEDQSNLESMRGRKTQKNFKIKQINIASTKSNLVQIKDQKNDTDQILFQGIDEGRNKRKSEYF